MTAKTTKKAAPPAAEVLEGEVVGVDDDPVEAAAEEPSLDADDDETDVDDDDAADIEVPEELQFSTGDYDTKVESITIKLNGWDVELRRPPRPTLLLSATAWSTNSTDLDRAAAIMDLINACLDETGRRILRSAMYDPEVAFNEDLLSDLMDLILTKWGEGVDGNRAQRRAAKKKRKKK